MIWTFVGVSCFFVLVRCFIKIKTFKRVSSDDIVVFIAWAVFFSNVVIWTKMSPFLYENYEILQGKRIPGPNVLERYGEFIHTVMAPCKPMFYTSLWSVKLSLLLFFRKLGYQIRSHEIWWWWVTAATVSTWLISMADGDWPCVTKPIEWIMSKHALWTART